MNSCFLSFKEFVYEHNFDILALSETWLSDNQNSNDFSLSNYKFVRSDRQSKRGGGVAFYIKNSIPYTVINIDEICGVDNFVEQLWIRCSFNKVEFGIGVVYKPPVISYSKLTAFERVLSYISPTVNTVLCTGDFNINYFDAPSLEHTFLNNIALTFNMTQVIDSVTREYNNVGSLIDLFFTSDPGAVMEHGVLDVPQLSDHKLIYCSFDIPKPKNSPKLITFRDLKNIDFCDFHHDAQSMNWEEILSFDNINDKVECLNTKILSLFDKHAPLKTIKVTKPHAPWITPVVKIMLKLKNKALVEYKRTKSQSKWLYYKQLRNLTTSAIRCEKQAYIKYCNKNQKDGKSFWSNLKKLGVNNKHSTELPEYISSPFSYCDFLSVQPQLVAESTINEYYNLQLHTPNSFDFHTVTVEEIESVVSKLQSNALGIDGISSMMLKCSLSFIAPFITHIVNESILNSVVPDNWKISIIKPFAKNNKPLTFNDLRPISILPAISKILERICCTQIVNYLEDNDIIPVSQSGFRRGYSTSACLLNLCDDITRAFDVSKVSLISQIDLSKAFDLVNYDLLVAKLKSIGFSPTALSWCIDYLSNRHMQVMIKDISSNLKPITCGVPQGSILGPIFFLIFTIDLHYVLEYCTVHAYADDTQLVLSFDPNDSALFSFYLNSDLERLSQWVINNGLRINVDKSALLLAGNKILRDKFTNSHPVIMFSNKQLELSDSIKILGVYLDSELNFSLHLNKKLQAAYLRLKQIYQYRSLLDSEAKLRLMNTLVLPIVYYCNLVYFPHLRVVDKNRLRILQNSCLRYAYGVRKYDHITFYRLKSNMREIDDILRLNYCIFTFKTLITQTPKYLYSKLLHKELVSNSDHDLRNKDKLSTPKFRTTKFRASFTYLAPVYFNDLPPELKCLSLNSFKTKIKTLL